MPVTTNPITIIVTISGGRSAQELRTFATTVFSKMRQTKGKPTPTGKNDQVISDDPSVKIENGPPTQMANTRSSPMSNDRAVNPPVSWSNIFFVIGNCYLL